MQFYVRIMQVQGSALEQLRDTAGVIANVFNLPLVRCAAAASRQPPCLHHHGFISDWKGQS